VNHSHCLYPVAEVEAAEYEIKIVREEFRLAQGRKVVAPKLVILKFREGERLFCIVWERSQRAESQVERYSLGQYIPNASVGPRNTDFRPSHIFTLGP